MQDINATIEASLVTEGGSRLDIIMRNADTGELMLVTVIDGEWEVQSN